MKLSDKILWVALGGLLGAVLVSLVFLRMATSPYVPGTPPPPTATGSSQPVVRTFPIDDFTGVRAAGSWETANPLIVRSAKADNVTLFIASAPCLCSSWYRTKSVGSECGESLRRAAAVCPPPGSLGNVHPCVDRRGRTGTALASRTL